MNKLTDYMKSFEPFLQRNKKRLSSSRLEYPESNSLSLNKKELEKGIEKFINDNKNKSNKKISTSTLQSNKKACSHKNWFNKEIFKNMKINLGRNSAYYITNEKKLNNNNSCPLLILNSLSKTLGHFHNKIKSKEKNNDKLININYNYKSHRNEKVFIRRNCLLKKKQFFQNIPIYSKRKIKTFYKSDENNFLLDKRIKIIKKPQTSELNVNDRNKSAKKIDKYEIEFNYKYQKMFDRKLPLNDLRNYKTILFEESKILQDVQKVPDNKEEKVFPNKKFNKSIKNSENKDMENNELQNKSKNSENNFETIELHGVVTKVMTKLPKTEANKSQLGNEDFHKIMKHPLLLEQFGYKFLRNLSRDYKIFENPLDDRDLIKKIHHLIINPNTKLFRNGNLMYNSAGFYRKKNDSAPPKDFKLLSKRGFIRLKNSKINKFKQDVEDNFQHIEDIKEKINLLMEKNKRKFKEHKEELDNENK